MTSVYPDLTRGHIALVDERGEVATFTDLGPYLDLWTALGTHLDPDAARSLGTALLAWADRPRSAPPVAPSADRTWLGDTPPDDLLPFVWIAPPEAPKDVETVDVDRRVGL